MIFQEGGSHTIDLFQANHDPHVFKNPYIFNKDRADLGDTITFNGRVQDVLNDDYRKAPRFCPAYRFLLDFTEQVCMELTEGFTYDAAKEDLCLDYNEQAIAKSVNLYSYRTEFSQCIKMISFLDENSNPFP